MSAGQSALVVQREELFWTCPQRSRQVEVGARPRAAAESSGFIKVDLGKVSRGRQEQPLHVYEQSSNERGGERRQIEKKNDDFVCLSA